MTQSASTVTELKSPTLASQEAILAALQARFESFSPQLQHCARYILDHPQEVGLASMRALAARAEVHPNSFVRLARALGFDGYEAMRERFRDFVRGGAGSSEDRARWLQRQAAKGGEAAVLGGMAEASMDNLAQMFESQDMQAVNQAVDVMLAARHVYVLGLGSAYPLAYNFWYLARMGFEHFVLSPRHGSLPSDDLVRMSAEDCLVAMTFQPYRVETVAALDHASAVGASTIAITDSTGASVYQKADLSLVAPTHTPHYFQSNAALTALIETLCALLVAKGGESAAQAIEKFDQARWDANIYLDY